MTVLAGLAVAAVVAWTYLLVGHGLFWRTDQRIPEAPDPPAWPDVVAIVPARNEAAVLPQTLPTLLRQNYPGRFRVVLVDDESSDGTARVAEEAASGTAGSLTVLAGTTPPPGWVGKVWAVFRGVAEGGAGTEAGEPAYYLLTDADIAHRPGTLAALVRAAEAAGLDLVSQMARLHAASFWERAALPAFVFFFAMLYPFRRVNRRAGRTAAAAGGCMLVRREALERAGGLERIRGALIDDVALGRLLKRRPGSGGVWLGHAAGPIAVESVRPYRFGDLWGMVARTAYTQLRYSSFMLAGTVVGLVLLFAIPPVAGIVGLVAPAADGPAIVAGGGGLAAWLAMAVTEAPVLRLYGLSPLRGLALPAVACLYAGMTVDSALRHRRGTGGAWKGRVPARARQGAGPPSTTSDSAAD